MGISWRTLAAFVMGWAATSSASAQCELELRERIKAYDPDTDDEFGTAVAVGAEFMVMGSPYDDDRGSVYVASAVTDELTRKIRSPGTSGGRFGFAVALDGATAVIGAPGGPVGRAWIFNVDTGVEERELVPVGGDVPNSFGYSVAIQDGVVVVGDPDGMHNGVNTGVVYIFDLATGDQLHRLEPPDLEAGDSFGYSVGLDGEIALIGATLADSGDLFSAGAGYLYDVQSGSMLHKLQHGDPAIADTLGNACAISDGLALLGAPTKDLPALNGGAVYVFDVATGQQLRRLVASDASEGALFGRGIAMRGQFALIGAAGDDTLEESAGAAYLFNAARGEELDIVRPHDYQESGLNFGLSVGLAGETAVVGARGAGDGGSDSGAAYVYSVCFDSDGDGLLDEWETDGIPYVDIHGVTQRYVLPDADPLRKNLYLELDVMGGVPYLDDAAIEMTVAFAVAPVGNPNGSTGIELEILRDDMDLPYVARWPTGGCWPNDFDTYRAAYFGTQSERSSPDAASILEAKAKAYRYGILADRAAPDSVCGCGELGGDNLVVFIGALGVDPLDHAAALMHELGHNLGLEHGGGDQVNGKPNYPSIMNYTMTYLSRWNAPFWRLDYAQPLFGGDLGFEPLYEAGLDETSGISGSTLYFDTYMPYGVNAYDGDGKVVREIRYVRLNGSPTDFGDITGTGFQDGVFDDNVLQDLNYILNPPLGVDLPTSPSPGEVLMPHDDWGNIVLATAASRGTSASGYPSDELTEEAIAWMDTNFPDPPTTCPADFNGDGAVNTQDVLAFLNAWAADDPTADFNGDGNVNTQDVLAFLNAWTAGC